MCRTYFLVTQWPTFIGLGYWFLFIFLGGVHDACDFSAMLVFDYGHSPKPAYQKNVAMVMYGVWEIPWIAVYGSARLSAHFTDSHAQCPSSPVSQDEVVGGPPTIPDCPVEIWHLSRCPKHRLPGRHPQKPLTFPQSTCCTLTPGGNHSQSSAQLRISWSNFGSSGMVTMSSSLVSVVTWIWPFCCKTPCLQTS